MAFVRWKTNRVGGKQAYLVQSYRDAQGKPKQKVLCYLGSSGTLLADQIVTLQQSYPNLKFDSLGIKPSARPLTDISRLSDMELLKRMRSLRHERQWNQSQMASRLGKAGLPPCTYPFNKGLTLSRRRLSVFEKAMESGKLQDFYLNPEKEVAPTLRVALKG